MENVGERWGKGGKWKEGSHAAWAVFFASSALMPTASLSKNAAISFATVAWSTLSLSFLLCCASSRLSLATGVGAALDGWQPAWSIASPSIDCKRATRWREKYRVSG